MVTTAAVKFDLKGLDSLNARIEAARFIMNDLRPLYETLASDFYKSEKQIFQLKGPGRYQDLSPRYKPQKMRAVGFLYPILFKKGALAASLLSRNARGSLAIITPHGMELGTTIPYAVYHHSKEPRTKIPRRPLWDENPTGPMLTRWNRITENYLKKAVQGAFNGEAGRGSLVARGS